MELSVNVFEKLKMDERVMVEMSNKNIYRHVKEIFFLSNVHAAHAL